MRLGLPLMLCLLMGAWLCPDSSHAAAPVIAVVVPASRPKETLSATEIALIFRRRKQQWRDGHRITPVNLPADDPLRRRFSRSVLQLSSDALEEYWNEQYFHGVLPPHVLASEEAVLRFVSDTDTAIGYLSYCAVDQRLRPVLLIAADGRLLPLDTPRDCKD